MASKFNPGSPVRCGDWKKELSQLLSSNNHKHAIKDKTVSFRTMKARKQSMFRSFTRLWSLGYKTMPSGLGIRHIRALMSYWTADPTFVDHCRAHHVEPRAEPYSTSHIQNEISMLRVLSVWIGKPDMIESAKKYTDKPELVRRGYVATYDHSWKAAGVDHDVIIEEVTRRNPYVGIQLEVALAFGLRRREAVMFDPHSVEPLAGSLTGTGSTVPDTQFLRIVRGTKGGRLRFVPIRNARQERALERAQQFAGSARHLGQPGQDLKQSLNRFSNTLRAVGVSMAKLGVTPHGLRHQFASDLYVDLTGSPPPVSGVLTDLDPEVQKDGYAAVAKQLGHNRPQISTSYLGSARTRAPRSELANDEE